MSNNRTEQQALIDALAPTVDLVELQAALVQAGYMFKKDVIITTVATSGFINLDFTNNEADQVVTNATGNVAYTLLNLEDGQHAKIVVNKPSANTVDFPNGVFKKGQQVGLTKLTFNIWAANGEIYIEQVSRQASGNILSGDVSFSGTQTLSTINYLRYNIDNDYIHFEGNIEVDPTTASTGFRIRLAGNFAEFLSTEAYAGCGYVDFENNGAALLTQMPIGVNIQQFTGLPSYDIIFDTFQRDADRLFVNGNDVTIVFKFTIPIQ